VTSRAPIGADGFPRDELRALSIVHREGDRRGYDRAVAITESPHFSNVVDEARVGLSTSELADLTGVKPRQVQNWAAGTSRPAGAHRDHLLEVHYLVAALGEVYEPEGVEIWLHARNRLLDGRRAIDLLREGRYDVVLDAIERLKSGAV